MRWSLLSLLLIVGCGAGRANQRASSPTAEQQARIGEAETAVTAARDARDAASRFLEVASSQDEAAQSQLRAQAINASTDLRAVASQTKREYARRLVLQRDAELQLAKDQLREARGEIDHERLAWESQRRAADYAKLTLPGAAPPRLEPIAPPATGANEGPSAGFQSLPDRPETR